FSALKIDKATIIGISQGSWTALKFATTRPEHIEKLVLMCPGGVVPDRISFVFRTVPLSLLGQWGIRRIVRMIFADQPVPEGVEEITALVMSSFKPRFGVLPLFSDEEMQRLTMPVLLLGGTKDVMRDHKKISARMNKFLPDLAVKMLPGAGHALLNTTGHIMPFLADEG
ncbi:MAG: alpha/beta hydrolase, partial [Anaerolineae bacterium]|nr:alpha/beta hydrolase [Anaerolineae bacterium]